MPVCRNCGRPFTGNVCPYCGMGVTQMPPQNLQQPQYPPTNYTNIAISLLFVGAIILSIGIFALAFVPDEITVGDVDTGSNEVSFEAELSGYKIGVILIGVGVLIEGIASALATKEHFRRLDNLRERKI